MSEPDDRTDRMRAAQRLIEVAAWIPVRKSAAVPLFDRDGEPVLFLFALGEVLVHPDRWDEFQLTINQRDIAAMPEVRAWFREQDGRRS